MVVDESSGDDVSSMEEDCIKSSPIRARHYDVDPNSTTPELNSPESPDIFDSDEVSFYHHKNLKQYFYSLGSVCNSHNYPYYAYHYTKYTNYLQVYTSSFFIVLFQQGSDTTYKKTAFNMERTQIAKKCKLFETAYFIHYGRVDIELL